MIYILRTLYSLGAILVYFSCAILLIIGFFSYPIVEGIYYTIHGSTDTMKWEVDTMAMFIEKKYTKLKDLIEKGK